MGMLTSDDEEKIAEDHALLEWAQNAPHEPWGWDHAPTEEERIAHEEAVKKHYAEKPRTRRRRQRGA